MKVLNKHAPLILYLLLGGLLTFLALNRHSKSGYFNYHSEIWADKAGYYMYLPAALKFGFDPGRFPQDIDKKTGEGFLLKPEAGVVQTKYTYGVALMELPFYLVADALSSDHAADGFGPLYHKSISVAAVFYLILGLWFLNNFLAYTFSKVVRFCTLATLLLGTNLFFYTIDEPGMSHVYSFCAFAGYLLLLRKTSYLAEASLSRFALLGFLAVLIIIVRPLNVIFLFVFFFLDAESMREVTSRLKRALQPLPALTAGFVALIMLAPQFAYWKYLTGKPLTYSYGNESFNWLNPEPVLYLFSPNNGMLIYTPVYLFIIAGMFYTAATKKQNGFLIPALFILLIYVFSSWWCWWYGCSLGARTMVEYLTLWCLPLAYLFQRIGQSSKSVIIILSMVCLACIAVNLKFTYTLDECFYGEHFWDWQAYKQLLFGKMK